MEELVRMEKLNVAIADDNERMVDLLSTLVKGDKEFSYFSFDKGTHKMTIFCILTAYLYTKVCYRHFHITFPGIPDSSV